MFNVQRPTSKQTKMDLEEISLIIDIAEDSMDQTVTHLQNELAKIRTGKANPTILDRIQIEYYGSQMPLNNVASISAIDGKTLAKFA